MFKWKREIIMVVLCCLAAGVPSAFAGSEEENSSLGKLGNEAVPSYVQEETKPAVSPYIDGVEPDSSDLYYARNTGMLINGGNNRDRSVLGVKVGTEKKLVTFLLQQGFCCVYEDADGGMGIYEDHMYPNHYLLVKYNQFNKVIEISYYEAHAYGIGDKDRTVK